MQQERCENIKRITGRWIREALRCIRLQVPAKRESQTLSVVEILESSSLRPGIYFDRIWYGGGLW